MYMYVLVHLYVVYINSFIIYQTTSNASQPFPLSFTPPFSSPFKSIILSGLTPENTLYRLTFSISTLSIPFHACIFVEPLAIASWVQGPTTLSPPWHASCQTEKQCNVSQDYTVRLWGSSS